MKANLYFAYGSNLSQQQMARRCPGAKLVGRAVLRNYRIAFGGHSGRWDGPVATVIHSPGKRVEGILYQLDQAELDLLDRIEGHPFSYRRVEITVTHEDGEKLKAFVYHLPVDEELAPSQAYFQTILQAYNRFDFKTKALVEAIRRAESDDEDGGIIKVFVYGTLMGGESNHRLLAQAQYLGEGRTQAEFELISLGWYPAMVPSGRTAISGEVYAVDWKMLVTLDKLEGHPSFYKREWIFLEDGERVLAYILAPRHGDNQKRIASGSWRNEIKERSYANTN